MINQIAGFTEAVLLGWPLTTMAQAKFRRAFFRHSFVFFG